MNERHVSTDAKVIPPGSTIGIVGGGQLGRMLALAAHSLGYRVVVLCERDDEPAAQVVREAFVGSFEDVDVIDRFARQCDVITLEFENIPAATIERCGRSAPTYPSADVLATAQDRLREKSTLQQAGLPVTPFLPVKDAASATAAAESLGWPMIVKTARSGYDGKGQHRVGTEQDVARVPWNSADGWIAERLIPFDREISVIVARSASGRTHVFPPFENSHARHILDVSVCPATLSPAMADQARGIAEAAAETLGVVGLLCVEMFVQSDQLRINEVAPRPHNSGHLTIEAFATSQFEQHVRAICDLPFGATELRSGGAAMANLLGDLWGAAGEEPDWSALLAVPGVHLHLYGKRSAQVGRKMGHVTALASGPAEAETLVRRARAEASRHEPVSQASAAGVST